MPSNRGIPTNEQDFMQMQNEAVRRVHEMQERARLAVERANGDVDFRSPEPHFVSNRRDIPPVERHRPEPEILEEPAPLQKKVLRKRRHNKILPFDFPFRSLSKSLDFEDMLLIGLILLLMNEETDEMIILALVYIFISDMDFMKKK